MTGSERGPHVLVVEDDPSVRGLLQTLLSAEGYEVAFTRPARPSEAVTTS